MSEIKSGGRREGKFPGTPLKKVDSWLDRNIFPFLAVLHICVLAGIVLFGDIKYEVSDDFMMEMILSGLYTGKPDVHIMFSNVCWAALLVPFYKIAPAVSWYLAGQLALCLASMLSVSYVLSKIQKWHTSIAITMLLLILVAPDLYILPQFTKTAVAATMAGSVLFLWAIFYGKSIPCMIMGGALTLLGSWVRSNAIYVVAPFVVVILICELPRFLRNETRKKFFFRVLLPGLVLIALVFGSIFLDSLAYSADSGYDFYRQYSMARAQIVDFPVFGYADHADALAAMGISENDYQMILAWNFGDTQVFSLEKLQQLGDALASYRQGKAPSLDAFLTYFQERQMNYPGATLCLVLAVYCIVVNWRKIWAPLAAILITLCFFYYFYCVGRSVYRVEFGYYYCAALLILFYSGKKQKRNVLMGIRDLAFFCAIMLFANTQMFLLSPDRVYLRLDTEYYRAYIDETFQHSGGFLQEKYSKTIKEGTLRPHFLQEVSSHPERLYVLDFNTTVQSLYYDFSPMKSAAAVFPENMLFLGGVTVQHPSVVDPMTGENTGALLNRLLSQEVYFVGNGAEDRILTYFREHGYPDVKAQLYDTIDDYQIWQFIDVTA